MISARSSSFRVLVASFAALLFAHVMPGASEPADTILTGGKIVTADVQFHIAQAVAIRQGKFVAVGSNADILARAGPGTKRIDLAGRTVLPGLIDTHAHIASAGNEGFTVSFAGVTTVAEALDRIKAWTTRVQPGEWIIGNGWHPPSQLKERRYLTRLEIDAAAPRNPVYLPTVGHFAMANSLALAKAGITRGISDPPGGVIERDSHGDPDGVLEESAIGLVSRAIPAAGPNELAARLQSAMRVFNSYGLTSAVDGGSSPDQFRVFERLWRNHEMTLRVSVMLMPGVSPARASPGEWDRALAALPPSTGFGDEWLRPAGIGELIADGGMTLKTAFLREPYPDEPQNRGFATIEPERLNQIVAACNRRGWRVGVHAVGDAAIDRVLDAYEFADRELPIAGRRFVVIHGSLIQPDQLKRAARLGVRVDMQNVFLWDKADTVARFLGADRANRAVPTRLMIDTLGIANVGAGTDYSVNTLDPFINMYIMVTRKNPEGRIFGKDQAITREEALRLYTSSAAGYNFEEGVKGSIEPGKLADLVVLSDDLLTVPEERIRDIRAVTTMVGGKIVYQQRLVHEP